MSLMEILLFAGAGGILYRLRGAAFEWKKYVRRPITQITFATPYAYLVYLEVNIWAAIVCLLVTTLAVLSGHGKFMDLGSWKKESDDERLEFTIKWLHGKMPEYWYDALGLAVTGVAVTLPAGIATLNPVIAISGSLKAVAYILGWRLGGTAWGEFLTGFLLYGVMALYL